MSNQFDDYVFVAFNSRVAALHRKDGNLVWSWKAPAGYGYVAILLDKEALFASVNGYTYALDPRTGAERWSNKMSGFGFGVPCLATVRGHSSHSPLGQIERDDTDSSSSSTLH